MDIYSQKSRWKVYLAGAGALIVLTSLVYTNYLSGQLAAEERNKVRIWARAMEQLNEPLSEECEQCKDLTLLLEIIQSNKSIPVIQVSDAGTIIDAVNFGTDDREALQQELESMREDGQEPIEGFGNALFYKESNILQQLRYFPFIQLILIGAFIGFGYLGFSSARRAEQNRVWVGMAKETAHQLGTPISAIVAWIEHLKLMRDEDEEVQDIIGELGRDVDRLQLIADRFSKIGSEPELRPANVYAELDACRNYMQRRASRRVVFDFPAPGHEPLHININPPLFEWVVENILRNALDAMEGEGRISVEVARQGDQVNIDITDSGKGIPAGKFKTVFQPGYTTKKRGWGLGLSLAKRIIEDYHNGRIFVKQSAPEQGTTFTIQLPVQP